MSNRIALFAAKEEIESYFDFQTNRESIFEPHYNIAPAQHIAVISKEDGEINIGRARWGLFPDDDAELSQNIEIEEAIQGIENGTFRRCVIPVSGYYKWKETGKRADHPFFIRMLDQPLMALAGIMYLQPESNSRDQRSCAIINTESNALVHPLDPEMPLQLDRELSKQWLDEESSPEKVIEDAKKLFLLTEMSALRVSKKVNDLSVNTPKLIQPLPK